MVRDLDDKCVRRISVSGILITVFVTVLGLVPSVIWAEEYRQHEAHEHGVAHLNVAVEGDNIYLEFTSPAANIVGFEHHPRTHNQKDAVKQAVTTLRKGDALFILSAGSKSQLAKSSVDTDIENHGRHESEPLHAHEEGHHGKEENHEKEHDEVDDHQHHSEFMAEYHFICKKPKKLARIEVKLFHYFPGIEHIKVQLLTGTKQTAIELTAKKNTISL